MLEDWSVGEIVSINTIEDLLKGDLWEYVTLSEVLEIIGKRECFGMGTTSKDKNGEVLFYQTSNTTRFYWIDPETFKSKSIVDKEEKFPFIAIFFPDADMQEFTINGDIEEDIIRCIEKTTYKDAALFLEGEFSNVKLSAAVHLPKLGLDSDIKFESFEKYDNGNWKAVGVYTENYLDEFSYLGRKIHLHIVNEDDRIGGHMVSGVCKDVKIKIYSIDKVKCLHSDLTVHSGSLAGNDLVFTAENLGVSNTENVKVLVRVDGKEQVEIIALKGKSSKKMVFRIDGRPKKIEVIIDPDNFILESDETNNRFEMVF